MRRWTAATVSSRCVESRSGWHAFMECQSRTCWEMQMLCLCRVLTS